MVKSQHIDARDWTQIFWKQQQSMFLTAEPSLQHYLLICGGTGNWIQGLLVYHELFGPISVFQSAGILHQSQVECSPLLSFSLVPPLSVHPCWGYVPNPPVEICCYLIVEKSLDTRTLTHSPQVVCEKYPSVHSFKVFCAACPLPTIIDGLSLRTSFNKIMCELSFW